LQVCLINKISWEVLTTTVYLAMPYVLIVIYTRTDFGVVTIPTLSGWALYWAIERHCCIATIITAVTATTSVTAISANTANKTQLRKKLNEGRWFQASPAI